MPSLQCCLHSFNDSYPILFPEFSLSKRYSQICDWKCFPCIYQYSLYNQAIYISFTLEDDIAFLIVYFKPEYTSNVWRIYFQIIVSFMSGCPNVIVSSAYCTFVTYDFLVAGNPLIHFASFAFSVITFRPSATKVNSRGDNRSPCLYALM